ncbi:LysR family transcriptional regulator [Thermopolyspora sp. NPDC052614]|uniref:LysR family transcriptional regulator n=1 Tax=Thermopolyspora sp. NPDC052614 TaxID=3155682 RepID=UPI00344623D8
MDTHLLRTFVRVVRTQSFSAAAADLGYTQSAVSQQIAALEGDLGTSLLRRRPVVPTEAGRRLLEHAEPLLLRLDAARADVLRAARPPHRPAVLATTPLALTPRLAGLLDGVGSINTADRDGVVAEVATGRADLGLVDGPAAPSDPLDLPDVGPLTTVRLAEEDLVVALPAGHPLAGRTGLRLDDLADALWLDATGVAALAHLRAVARIDGLRPGVAYHGGDVHTLMTLAAAGLGLTLLPASIRPAAGLATVPLTRPRLVHRIELVHAHLPPGTARDLAACLTRQATAGGRPVPRR